MEEAKVGKILLMLIIENVHHSLWVSVTRRILWVPQTLQNKTLGVHWGILGLFFFTGSPPHWGHENVDCISQWQSMPNLEDKVGECAAFPLFHRPPYLLYPSILTRGLTRVKVWASLRPVIKRLQLDSYRAALAHYCFLMHYFLFSNSELFICSFSLFVFIVF